MDPLDVVVVAVLLGEPPEVLFAEDDHVVEQLAAAGPDPPLSERVLPGAAVCRSSGSIPRFRIVAVTSTGKIESRS